MQQYSELIQDQDKNNQLERLFSKNFLLQILRKFAYCKYSNKQRQSNRDFRRHTDKHFAIVKT